MQQAINEIENCGFDAGVIEVSIPDITPKLSKLIDQIIKQRLYKLFEQDSAEMPLLVKRLHSNAKLPTKAHDNDAGYDLYCIDDVILKPGLVNDVSTGIALAIPDGYVGLIWDRSSMGSKGIKVMGGVIDAGYRGELKLKLAGVKTMERDWLELPAGSKVAQILIQKIENMSIVEVDELPESQRGQKGFGSSGV